MKALVTGGAGFIGSHIVDRLINEGYDVVVIDDLTSGRKENLNARAKFYKADIREQKIDKIFRKEKPDFVFHKAAQIDVGTSIENPSFDADINLIGTLKLFENCIQNGVKKIIIPSSAAIYGEPTQFPIPENARKFPTIPYAFGKLAVEQYADFYSRVYNMGVSILRYSNVYGPRQSSPGEGVVVEKLIKKYLKSEEPVIYGDGNQTRDFIFVGDVVEASLLAAKKTTPSPLNVSTSKETTINDLAEKVAKILSKKTKPRHAPARLHEVYRSCLDNRLAKKVLGWEPKVSLSDGLKITIDSFLMGKKNKDLVNQHKFTKAVR